jgi:drug/metabolite transporter (DMT)-like permease
MALMAIIVKMGSSNLRPESMVFWRNLIGLMILLPWLQFSSPHQSLKAKLYTKEWKLHLIRGVSNFFAAYLYFYSLKFLNLTSATLLFNTMPIFVPFVAFFWKKIAIHHRLWWAIGCAFLGIVCILRPGTQIFQFASCIALLSGIFGAISLVSLRLSHYTEPPIRVFFSLFIISALCSGLVSLFFFKDNWEHLALFDFKLLIPLGIFGFLFQVCITLATKFATARLLSPFLYMTVVFAFIFDKIIWNVPVTGLSLVGFFLIVSGAVLMLVLYPKDDLKVAK